METKIIWYKDSEKRPSRSGEYITYYAPLKQILVLSYSKRHDMWNCRDYYDDSWNHEMKVDWWGIAGIPEEV